jgi:hypothetical protein
MPNNSPTTDERLSRSLSLYWASDRDETGELLQEQAILAEQEHPGTVRTRALLAQHEHDRQEAFAQLNPDFGVLPDSRDPHQHRFAHQRERALALGERVAAAEQAGQARGEPSDIVSFPRLQAPPHAPAERATDDPREGTRQRLLAGLQRRQATRAQRPSARASRSTRARTNPAEQERER